MKKRYRMLGLMIGLLLLAACGKKVDDGSTVEVLPLEVELTVTEQAEVGETVKMEALVTYGDEKVTDADKVVYEVWEEGKKDDSVMIDSVNEKDGTYTAETTFDHDGIFNIQVHVDAKNLHTMPVKQVTIGEGAQVEEAEQSNGHDHGHVDGFALHFVKPENATTGEETEMMTHLEIDGEPLVEAKIRYEVSSEVLGEKHLWIDAEEIEQAEYIAVYPFEKAGTYLVKVHVENADGLHEHEEFTFDVK
ncbi:FixH family protein [Sporosarcina sp. ACRSL]|uniref:FixH family protein n=1 Tax=Sporosarcina sp. ACRSL TaxID=2918215 RepID=UPI001EF51F21|nr:FixH family protein [Sporosarcina sp. ACRSL]MCG7344538.1 FixH family protein [Sporosarcina sp. ACRSL]